MAMDSTARPRVLIADEDANTRLHAQRVLKGAYEVHAVGDGEAALAASREDPPALVLADVMMPRLDGFGLLHALRNDPHTREIPVILLSARSGEEAHVESLDHSADYLIKPFSARELLARVSARLEIARLHREALQREHKLRLAAEDAEAEVAMKNQQLHEADARNESVLASISDTHILFDRQWRYVYVNEAASRAIGLPPEQILGRTLLELFPDIRDTELERQYRHAMEERAPVTFDFYSTHDSWWANRFYPTPEGLAVFATDITERKRSEDTLRCAHDELERRVFERTLEISTVNAEMIAEIGVRARAEAELLTLKDELGAELAAMTRLHEFSTRLLATTELQQLLEELLDASIAIVNADFGNVQIYDPKSQALKIVAQRGFEQDFLDYFDKVQEGTASCGAALERRERVIVEDVLTDPVFAQHLLIVHRAGYRAVQSTPLISRGGEMLGIISTHFRQPHRPSERELRFVDLYARQAAEMIERQRVESALLAAKEEAERRAREAEEAQSILKTIMEYAPEGITLTAGPPDFPIIANSKHAAQMIGRDAGTLLNIAAGSHAAAYGILLPDGTRPRPAQLPLHRASRHGEVIKNEEWIIERPDGNRIHELSNVAPIRDSRGQVIGAINCWHEITEIKRAEEALRASEERFRRYFELGLIGMALTSPSKGILEVNDEICRILGYKRSELLQKTWAEMTHPDDRPADVAQFNRVMVGEIDGYTMDKRWIRKDGAIIDSTMSARCMRCADGSVEYFVGLVLDTTERKRAEEKLRRSEANLAEGQRISQTGSLSTNLSTGEIYCSQELLRIFGLPTEGMVSREMFLDLVHPEDRKHVCQAFDHAVSIKSKYENTYRIVGPDGEIKYIHALSHPVFQESGEAKEYVGTVIDITERKRAEERLQNAQADLAHVTRLTTMVELAASIAHEINQPLGAVVNNSNVALRLAKEANESRGELMNVLSDIVNDANRASAIIARIRAVMRKSAPERTPLQLKDVVTDVLALAQHKFTEHRIEVRTVLPEDLPSVSGDRVQLQQVLLNLVMNGIDAMSDMDEARRILTIGGQRNDLAGQPSVLIAVRDFGNGFSAEDNERLFDAFYTTKPEGMGMGLRISRSIVEAHGGRLWAQVNEDIGATFLFALPVDD